MEPSTEAKALRRAEAEGGFVPLFTDRFPDFGWLEARAVARASDRLRRDAGQELIGYKLGWTSSAMREALGIERPNWGTLWDVHRLEGELDRSGFRHPKIEPEFVYVVGDRLAGDVSPAAVRSAAAGWAVGLEVVDPRFFDFDFRFFDNTADNSSAGGVALSPLMVDPVGDPADWVLEFSDGAERRAGTGKVVMGSPAAAVAWLVAQLAAENAALEPGMIVFTGGVTAPFDAIAGSRFEAVAGELGVSVSLVVR